MTRKLFITGMVLLVVAVVAFAADAITGKWTFEMQGRGGGGGGGTPRIVTLDLKADGATLTGSVIQPGRGGAEPTPTAIANGKIDGSNISFEVTRQGQAGPTTTKYVGTVSGNEMKLKVTAPGRGGGEPTTTEVTAKKSTT